jgi:putative nucleotidyltransferase with HDIG domain
MQNACRLAESSQIACRTLPAVPGQGGRTPKQSRTMLKKIPVDAVRLGMFIHALEGSWLSHPFWRTKFVLADTSDLEALRGSGIPFCWIDVAQGLDAEEPQRAPAPAPEPVAAPPVAAAPAPKRVPDRTPANMRDELARAEQLVNRSRKAVISLFNEARLGKAVQADDCLPLVDELAGSVARNPSALISLARLKTKDDYTFMHSVAVCALMVSLARQLGLQDEQVRQAGLAGLLHDIGKMQMPQAILNKPGALTDEEFAIMRSHPKRGFEILREGRQVPKDSLDVCLHHHEKSDGTGYPRKLAGEQISLIARMGAVCDVYDAITSNRPYKQAWDPATSLMRMAQWKGHFDTRVFQAFIKCVGIYPVGSLVKMHSGRLGVVLEQSADALTAPRVKVFYSIKSQSHIPERVVDLARNPGADKIVGREEPATWGFKHIEDLWRKDEA